MVSLVNGKIGNWDVSIIMLERLVLFLFVLLKNVVLEDFGNVV